MKLTLANIKGLKRNSDNPLTRRVCNYVIDRWGDYSDKSGMIDFEKAKTSAKRTLADTLKRVFPDRHVHELRYTFISRCKECVQNGNLKIFIASK